MQHQPNLLDPLGILGGVKRQVDTTAAQAQMPAALQPKNVARLLDPLGVFTGNNAGTETVKRLAGIPSALPNRPGMAREDRTSTDRR